MVRAILEGRKTQTRRAVKPQPMKGGTIEELAPGIGVWQCQVEKIAARPGVDSRFVGKIGCEDIHCPYGRPGDRLWVRESIHVMQPRHDGDTGSVLYRADGHGDWIGKWKPSIHMPRWASRIALEVVSVRVERLNEISGYDAIAEGIEPFKIDLGGAIVTTFRDYLNNRIDRAAHQSYRSLWESINGPESWAENPWVWVVKFKRVEGGGQ